jgi:DNA polymerase-3 subunit alpha
VQTKVSSKSQKKFAILSISDGTERFELPVWPEMYEEKALLLKENQLVYGILQKEKKEGATQLSCRFLEDLTQVDEAKIRLCDDAYDKLKAQSRSPEPKWKAAKEKTSEKEEIVKVKISLDADKARLSEILLLKELLRSHPGKSTLDLHFLQGGKRMGVVAVDAQWGVKADRAFQDKLKALCLRTGAISEIV